MGLFNTIFKRFFPSDTAICAEYGQQDAIINELTFFEAFSYYKKVAEFASTIDMITSEIGSIKVGFEEEGDDG